MSASPTIPIKVEFMGGLDLAFSGQRSCKVELPVPTKSPSAISSVPSNARPASADSLASTTVSTEGISPTVNNLVSHLVSTYLSTSKSKRDMFVLADGSVRPGILVLVNEADWELEGEGNCELQAGDEVVFVSTLHGG